MKISKRVQKALDLATVSSPDKTSNRTKTECKIVHKTCNKF